MQNQNLGFDEVLSLINHIGEEERHFNELELEYRKLASQWLLVALGAIGYVLSRENKMFLDPALLVICISVAGSIGIFVLWLLDVKVYHQLLHAAFKEGIELEKHYPDFLPPIRINMANTQESGDIVRRVVFYYYFSILLLLVIANIALWLVLRQAVVVIAVNACALVLALVLYRKMVENAVRSFGPRQS